MHMSKVIDNMRVAPNSTNSFLNEKLKIFIEFDHPLLSIYFRQGFHLNHKGCSQAEPSQSETQGYYFLRV